MKLGPEDGWVPCSRYHDVLCRSMLGQDSRELETARVLQYRDGGRLRQGQVNQLLPLNASSSSQSSSASKPSRALPSAALKTFDAPGLLDDFYARQIDWSVRDVLAVALSSAVYL